MTPDQTTAPAPRISFGGLVRSERIKARGLRSTRRLLVTAGVLPVVTTLIAAAVSDGAASSAAGSVLSSVASLSWMPLLVVMLLATVVATSEYERGAVLTTFAVVPRRTGVVLAKVVVVAVAVLVVLLVSLVVAFLAAVVVEGGSLGAIGDLEVVRVLVGTAVYGAAAATIAMSIGMIVRSSIAGIAATLGFLYVLPALLQAVPVAAVTAFARTIPGPASTPLDTPGHVAGELSFVAGLAAVLAWTVVTVAVSCAVLRRRDV